MSADRPVSRPTNFASQRYDEEYIDEDEEWYDRYGYAVSGRNRKSSEDRARSKRRPKRDPEDQWDE